MKLFKIIINIFIIFIFIDNLHAMDDKIEKDVPSASPYPPKLPLTSSAESQNSVNGKSLTQPGESSPEEKDDENNSHIYGLKESDAECHTLFDSRALLKDFKILGNDFTEWHKVAIRKIKKMTPQVRQALHYKGTPSKTNLLIHNICLIASDEQGKPLRLEIEDKPGIWVSAWPGGYNRSTLEREFPQETFLTFDSFLPEDKRELRPRDKMPLLDSKIFDGYCFGKHGYLIHEREDLQQKSCKRAKSDIDFFNQNYIHTEQALLLYMMGSEFKEKIKDSLTQNKITGETTVVVSLASSNSSCLRCADRMFRESEWGHSFLESLRKELEIELKVRFFVSSADSLSDWLIDLETKSLKDRLRKEKQEARLIGFDRDCKIIFMNSQEEKPINSKHPFIGQLLMNQQEEVL